MADSALIISTASAVSTTFVIKCIVSFFVGGVVIALLSILAERFPRRGGLIMSIPSTLPLGLLFIGWSQDVDAALEAVAVVPAGVAALLVFTAAFINLAQLPRTRSGSAMLANSGALIIWAALAVPMVLIGGVTLTVGLLAYLLAMVVTWPLLRHRLFTVGIDSSARQDSCTSLSRWPKPPATITLIIIRALTAGAVVATCTILAKVLGPVWGGLFATFPAAYITTLNFLLFSRGPSLLIRIGSSVPAGTTLFIIYTLLSFQLFKLGIWWGTLTTQVAVLMLMTIGGILIRERR